MGTSDTILFENAENFIQSTDWGNLEIPNEVLSLLKEDNNFKTKDLDNCMGNYMVFSDGCLKAQYFEEYQCAFDSYEQKNREYWMDEYFSGKIKIFSDNCIDFSDKDWNFVFELSFINGFLIKSCCVKCAQSENTTRKINKNSVEQKLISRCREKLRSYAIYLLKLVLGIGIK